jgi:small GTP-binding protein
MPYKKHLTFEKRGVPISVLGLPRAGKTTFVNRLNTGEFSEPEPTLGVNFERLNIQDAKFDVFDLGGHQIYRETIWENYIKLSYGVIFIVDSSDHEVLPEAKEEFWKSVELKRTDDEFLILFLCNKSDLEKSLDLDTLVKDLDLYRLAKLPNVTYQFFKTSMKTGDNFEHVLNWLHTKTSKLIEKKQITPSMFLVAERDGLPVFSIDKKDIQHDPHLISGFLSAVESFTVEVFGIEGILQFVLAEKHKYIIYATEENIYATLIGIDESQEEARRILEIIGNYHRESEDNDILVEFIMKAFKLNKKDYSIQKEY